MSIAKSRAPEIGEWKSALKLGSTLVVGDLSGFSRSFKFTQYLSGCGLLIVAGNHLQSLWVTVNSRIKKDRRSDILDPEESISVLRKISRSL